MFFILVWICSPSRILGFGVQLEGVIDLGENWGYEYKLSPLSTTELPMFSDSRKDRKDMELTDLDTTDEKDQNIFSSHSLQLADSNDSVNNLSIITQTISTRTEKRSKKGVTKKSGIRSQTGQKLHQNADKKLKKRKKLKTQNNKSKASGKRVRISKYVIQFEDFMMDVHQRALVMWDNIINKIKWDHIINKIKGIEVKSKVTEMKIFFQKKYQEFMNLFKKQKLRTKLGSQKFVLNTIETSNRIMERLVNSLSTYDNFINGGYNKLQQEFEIQKQLQYAYACKKFAVCRTSNDFGDYLIELINIILQNDNTKIKQAADALTEVVKTNDFTQIIEPNTQDKLKKQMANIELWDPLIVKSMFVILRNVLSHKNQPMVIMIPMDLELSNKTVAFHEIIDTLNKNIYKPDNTTDFIKIKKQFEEWRDGSLKEVQKAFHSLIQLIKKGLQQIDKTAAQETDNNMNIILRPMISKTFEI